MTYATRTDMTDRFGEDEIAELEASGSDLQDGSARTDAALSDATHIIDGYLSARYATPLTTPPALVIGWACDIARYKMWDESAPAEVRRRFEDAMSQLRDAARGTMSLPGQTAPASGVAFAHYSDERVFTRDTLAGF